MKIKKEIILTCIVFVFFSCKTQQAVQRGIGPKEINTYTDPFYVYEYNGAKFVPPEGTVLYIAGQDRLTIREYVRDVKIPAAGYASYCGVSTNTGITNDMQVNEHERQNLAWAATTYPNTVSQSAMWMCGLWDSVVLKNVVNGTYDENIDTYITWANVSENPIYLRIGYEFDGPHNANDPELFVAAYTYIVDRMCAGGCSNIAYVWHSYAADPYNGYALSSWYPGDEYVDWFAISYYNQVRGNYTQYIYDVINLARDHRKPVMIAESTPVGGIIDDNYETWNSWFVPMFSFMYKYNIKAFSYINCEWAYVSSSMPDWGDCRLQQYPKTKKLFIAEINKDRYLKASPELFSLLGYE